MRLEVHRRVEEKSVPPFSFRAKKDCKCGTSVQVKASNGESLEVNYCPVCGRSL